MPPWVTYTLLAACGGLVVAGLALGDRVRSRPARAAWLAAEIVAVIAAYLLLRPGRGADARSVLARSAASDRPVFVEMYSNY